LALFQELGGIIVITLLPLLAMQQAVSLSMVLGAFLAGLLLAGSENRRELETDLKPFKGLLLMAMARAMGIPLAERPVFAVMLAQGGEFGFVVLQAAGGAALVPASDSSFLLAAIAISMLLTPLVMVLVDRVLARRLAARAGAASPAIAATPRAWTCCAWPAPTVPA
jgi:glutathione-regulated potassium-efflux system ancillary protein KefC